MAYQYHIGESGTPWKAEHKALWLSQQQIKRSYQDEVVQGIQALEGEYTVQQYGQITAKHGTYPLYALLSKDWSAHKPNILITGGVHGYETSGVQGALRFAHENPLKHAFNFIIVPCVSPWAYETINRWNQDAIDPNRSFYADSPAPESAALMHFIEQQQLRLLAHFDLHETTDTDNSEFRPALAARDGLILDEWEVPDGFYTVANSHDPQEAFQAAIIASVKQVTHIAPADANGKIIGATATQQGVIHYDKRALFLCGGFSNAQYVTTTEVYPDSPKTSPEQCNQAQVAAVVGGLRFLQQQAKA